MAQPGPENPRAREIAALVALLRYHPESASWSQIGAQVAESGSALALWESLSQADSGTDEVDLSPVQQAQADLRRWHAQGLRVVTLLDPDYPAQLRDLRERPPILFYRGTVVPDDTGVAVVGSRTADADALALTREVATGLVAQGLSVLSGLARGVDATAHTAALDAGGRTVAFLAGGIRSSYPRENRALHERIAREGLVISPFWPDAPVQRRTLPVRNLLMTGYARAVVVAAGGETSGVRGQVALAVEHRRPVILQVRVARETSWAMALRGRPGIYVGRTPAEVLAAVRDAIRPFGNAVDEILRRPDDGPPPG
jgi:DNA processing protein